MNFNLLQNKIKRLNTMLNNSETNATTNLPSTSDGLNKISIKNESLTVKYTEKNNNSIIK